MERSGKFLLARLINLASLIVVLIPGGLAICGVAVFTFFRRHLRAPGSAKNAAASAPC